MTLATQVEKLKQRFRLDHVVLVGDRGMITQARITDDIKAAGLDWITALRAPAIKALLQTGALQLSLFDQRDMASITAPDFPGERLVVCRNPDLALRAHPQAARPARRHRTRSRTHPGAGSPRKRDPLRGIAEIALAVGAVRRWRATPSPPRSRPTIRSPSSPGQRRSSRKRSISSVSDVASSTGLRQKIVTKPQELTRSPSSRGKTRCMTRQAGWPRQRMRSESGGTAVSLRIPMRSPR